MNIRNLLTSSYWFSQPFMIEGRVRWFFIISFLLLVSAGIILLIIRHKMSEKVMKVVLGRWSVFAITMGLIGLLWYSFRQQYVLLLGWRFWLLVWAVILGIWLYRLLRYTFLRVPQIKADHLERMRREKYLPKSK